MCASNNVREIKRRRRLRLRTRSAARRSVWHQLGVNVAAYLYRGRGERTHARGGDVLWYPRETAVVFGEGIRSKKRDAPHKYRRSRRSPQSAPRRRTVCVFAVLFSRGLRFPSYTVYTPHDRACRNAFALTDYVSFLLYNSIRSHTNSTVSRIFDQRLHAYSTSYVNR